jgi:hypothetical protein
VRGIQSNHSRETEGGVKRIILAIFALSLTVACFADINVSTQTGTVNLSAGTEVAVGTYTAAQEGPIAVRFNLSTMNGAAATLTPIARVYSSSGTIQFGSQYSDVKLAATDTTYGGIFTPLFLHVGEKVRLSMIDTNASDTSVSWSMDVFLAGRGELALPPTNFGSLLVSTGGRVTTGGGTIDSAANAGSVDVASIWNFNTASITAGVGSLLLNDVDAKISTRLATSGYTAPTPAPTAAANADAILNDTRAGTAGTVAAKITAASSNSAVGPGADRVTITWSSSTSHLPIANGLVWVTTDQAGANTVAGKLLTDDHGHATFLLTAGSHYYLWGRAADNQMTAAPFTAVADTP